MQLGNEEKGFLILARLSAQEPSENATQETYFR
jgi:hypothetical protein